MVDASDLHTRREDLSKDIEAVKVGT